ncbi:PREDICTED: uncharacterized protein LOC106146826, partial [Chinchilla lanigera]|uniref:uncharacterized protein LOC106146826 n=1 Tax=Chinchilla lanigera TaxID=34839 RepID=UPI00069790A1
MFWLHPGAGSPAPLLPKAASLCGKPCAPGQLSREPPPRRNTKPSLLAKGAAAVAGHISGGAVPRVGNTTECGMDDAHKAPGSQCPRPPGPTSGCEQVCEFWNGPSAITTLGAYLLFMSTGFIEVPGFSFSQVLPTPGACVLASLNTRPASCGLIPDLSVPRRRFSTPGNSLSPRTRPRTALTQRPPTVLDTRAALLLHSQAQMLLLRFAVNPLNKYLLNSILQEIPAETPEYITLEIAARVPLKGEDSEKASSEDLQHGRSGKTGDSRTESLQDEPGASYSVRRKAASRAISPLCEEPAAGGSSQRAVESQKLVQVGCPPAALCRSRRSEGTYYVRPRSYPASAGMTGPGWLSPTDRHSLPGKTLPRDRDGPAREQRGARFPAAHRPCQRPATLPKGVTSWARPAPGERFGARGDSSRAAGGGGVGVPGSGSGSQGRDRGRGRD